MKHLSTRRRRKPIWLLYLLAAVAVVFAVIALVKTVGSLGLFQKTDPTEPPSISGSEPGDTTATEPTPEDLDTQRQTLLGQCETLLKSYFYDEVIDTLSKTELKNDQTDALLDEARRLKNSLVLYEGEQLYHVFFHSLIIDTDKAFDGDIRELGYNEYMTTRYEFEKMLPLFLENDFILYDIKEMVEFVDGKSQRKPIYLPEGKKPLVISIDDVCYYDYMETDGFATRLDVDDEGNVVTIVKDSAGNEQVTYDGDVMPILDAFVKEHPEFSYRGYKGIVAVTGYQGAYGYRITDLEETDSQTGQLLYDAETAKWMQGKVVQVSDALRATGWDIACHSYTHNAYWSKGTITEERYDHYEKRWFNEMAPYLGQVDIFISPNGAYSELGKNHWAVRRLVDSGFHIYCPVGSGMQTSYPDDFMLQDRMNLDGINLIKNPERIKKYFFDPALVVDPARPPF